MPTFVLRWRGEAYQLAEARELVVGRGEGCHLPLNDPSVSRRHVAVVVRDGVVVVRDLGSAGGTFLDGERVVEERVASGASVINVGGEEMSIGLLRPNEKPRRISVAIPVVRERADETTRVNLLSENLIDQCDKLVRGGRWAEARDAWLTAFPVVLDEARATRGGSCVSLRRASRCFVALAAHGAGHALVVPVLDVHEAHGSIPDEPTTSSVVALVQSVPTLAAGVRAFLARLAPSRTPSTDARQLKRLAEATVGLP